MKTSPSTVRELIRLSFCLCLFLPLLGGCTHAPRTSQEAPPAAAETTATRFELAVLHVNDMHSHFDPGRMPELPMLPDASFGGYPAVLSYVNTVRAERTNTLFLHGGDDFQGTGYFVLTHGRANADLLNRMGVDAMATGNHEFDELRDMQITYADDGETVEQIVPGKRIPRGKPFADFLDLINFPVLTANMNTDGDPYLAGKTNLLPRVIVDVAGEAVGIFGIALENMPSISSPGADVVFMPEVESARRAVEALEAQGVNKIIGISHIGYMADKRLASSVDGIDILLGGHSHDLLGDFTALGLPYVGDYPTVVTTPSGGQTLVVQAGAYAKAVGRLDVTFDEDGRIVAWSGGNKLLALEETLPPERIPEGAVELIARVAEDPGLRAHIDQAYKPELERIYGAPIARVPVALPHERTPSDPEGHGSQVAPIAAEALCWFMNRQGTPVQASIINAGGVRTSIDAGYFHRNQTLLEVMIFGNAVATFPLTGAQLRNVLVSVIEPGLLNSDHDGRFPYVGRLSFVFDASQPEGERLVSLKILDEEGHWEDVEDDQTYLVAASAYVAEGNDGYDLLHRYITENGGGQSWPEIVDNQVFTAYVMHRTAEGHDLTALPYPTVKLEGRSGEASAPY